MTIDFVESKTHGWLPQWSLRAWQNPAWSQAVHAVSVREHWQVQIIQSAISQFEQPASALHHSATRHKSRPHLAVLRQRQHKALTTTTTTTAFRGINCSNRSATTTTQQWQGQEQKQEQQEQSSAGKATANETLLKMELIMKLADPTAEVTLGALAGLLGNGR